MKNSINVDTKTFVRFWLVVISFGLVGFAVYKALPALVIIGISLFLAIALNPPVSYISQKLNNKSRVISTALAYIVVILLLGVIVFLVIPPVAEQTAKFIQTVPSMIDSVSTQYSVVKEVVDKYNIQPQFNEVISSIKASATNFASSFGMSLLSSIGSIVSLFANMVIVLVLTFLILVEGPTWMRRIWNLYGNQDRMSRHRATFKRMYSVVTGYVSGQLTVSAIDGVFSGLVVFILSLVIDVPANLVIPTIAIMFVLSLIPLFGATMGALFIGLVLAINSPIAAVIFIIYFLLYQQIENNFIAPKIQSKKLNLSPLIILVSIVIGIVLFGIIGGIISIPIAGCIKILIEDHFLKSKVIK
jgi:predicted PurR-regulated permease PerM